MQITCDFSLDKMSYFMYLHAGTFLKLLFVCQLLHLGLSPETLPNSGNPSSIRQWHPSRGRQRNWGRCGYNTECLLKNQLCTLAQYFLFINSIGDDVQLHTVDNYNCYPFLSTGMLLQSWGLTTTNWRKSCFWKINSVFNLPMLPQQSKFVNFKMKQTCTLERYHGILYTAKI